MTLEQLATSPEWEWIKALLELQINKIENVRSTEYIPEDCAGKPDVIFSWKLMAAWALRQLIQQVEMKRSWPKSKKPSTQFE